LIGRLGIRISRT